MGEDLETPGNNKKVTPKKLREKIKETNYILNRQFLSILQPGARSISDKICLTMSKNAFRERRRLDSAD